MVSAQFSNYLSAFVRASFGLSPGAAAHMTSAFHLGCLIATTAGARAYAKLPPRSRRLFLAGALALTTACPAALLAHAGGVRTLSAGVVRVVLFAWGLAACVPFYIPPTAFALRFGGARHASLVTNLVDSGTLLMPLVLAATRAMSRAAAAADAAKVAGIAAASLPWRQPLGIAVAASAAAAVAMVTAVSLDMPRKEADMSAAAKREG